MKRNSPPDEKCHWRRTVSSFLTCHWTVCVLTCAEFNSWFGTKNHILPLENYKPKLFDPFSTLELHTIASRSWHSFKKRSVFFSSFGFTGNARPISSSRTKYLPWEPTWSIGFCVLCLCNTSSGDSSCSPWRLVSLMLFYSTFLIRMNLFLSSSAA